jgi:cell filamentation protein
MELQILDPFGDHESAGYLRNVYGVKDLELIGHLETAVFQQEVFRTARFLRRVQTLQYEHLLETHRQFFHSLYPWAGEDRSITAPHLAIVKAGYKTLFCHPAECRRAGDYALQLGQDVKFIREHPGEAFGYFAHAHPFLEGNGRTILTMFAELTRRAGFHIDWEAIDKRLFLSTLNEELLKPSRGTMDGLVLPYVKDGVLTEEMTAWRLRVRFKPELPADKDEDEDFEP